MQIILSIILAVDWRSCRKIASKTNVVAASRLSRTCRDRRRDSTAGRRGCPGICPRWLTLPGAVQRPPGHSLDQLRLESVPDRRSKVSSEVTSLTWSGREFQALAAAAGIARSPSVDRRVNGISTIDELADRRRCRVERLETGQMVSAR